MTNREYLAQNPEEMRGMLRQAREYVERVHGTHERLIMTDEELLDKWLDAERDYEAAPKSEKTYIAHIAITMHHADSMNADEIAQVARVAAQALKRSIAEIPSLHDIDDVTIERVKEFVWG